MRILLAVVLLFMCESAVAAAPSVTCTPSITDASSANLRTAPVGVVVDCTGTTGGTTPFHGLEYRHSFGDSSADSWANGNNTSASKNFATGAVAGHVYETAGSYTITSIVCNSSDECAQVTNALTVVAANTTFSQANTKCYYQTTASGDCPNGGDETQQANFNTALEACRGTGKRCLFQRGSQFTTTVSTTISVAGMTIGAYGSGALPKVTMSYSCDPSLPIIAIDNAAVNGLRIMDLELTAAADPNDKVTCTSTTADVANVTLLRVTCHDTGGGFINEAGSGFTGGVIQDSTVYNMKVVNGGGGMGLWGWFNTYAILGGSFGPSASGQQMLRLQPAQKVAVSHNTLTGAVAGKEVVAVRAAHHVDDQATYDNKADTQYVVFSDNKIIGGAAIQVVLFSPGGIVDNDFNQWIYDVIVERNWIVFGTGGQQGFIVNGPTQTGSKNTVRNNVCVTSGANAYRQCFMVGVVHAGAPAPTGTDFLNNTCYQSDASSQFDCVTIGDNTNKVDVTTVQNNLAYSAGAVSNGAKTVVVGSTAENITGCATPWTTCGNGNSSNAQVTENDPLFTDTSTFSGFRPAANGYGVNNGAAVFPNSDGLVCVNNSKHVRSGAFEPRVEAQCRGAAGP